MAKIIDYIISEYEYNKMRNDSVSQLSEQFPNINVENLIRCKWTYGIPFFYIENPRTFFGE